MDYDTHQIAVLTLGILAVAGIIYTSFSAPVDSISGYAILSRPQCCTDCSCPHEMVCLSCGECIWATECSDFKASLQADGLELISPARVTDGAVFNLYAVVRPKEGGKYKVLFHMPNGLRLEGENPRLIDAAAGKVEVVSVRARVLTNVAEQDHVISADLVRSDWKPIATAKTNVNVYWDR